MLAHEVAKKYAHGLFLAVREKDLTDRAFRELEDLQKYLESDATLLNFLVAPHVLDEHKLALVRDVFHDRLHQLLIQLLELLVRKHRVGFLPEVIDEFVRLTEAERGIGRATVITAIPLTDGERAQLIEKLAAKTSLRIEIEPKVDPTIIGGVIVIMYNEIIDGSIRRQLDLVREQLTKVRVH
jgi:F-type H+-transporting ATPase subunit delta